MYVYQVLYYSIHVSVPGPGISVVRHFLQNSEEHQTIINTLNVQNVYSYDIHVKVFFRAKTGAFQMEAFTQDCLEAKKNTKEKLSMIADSEEEEGLISLHLNDHRSIIYTDSFHSSQSMFFSEILRNLPMQISYEGLHKTCT